MQVTRTHNLSWLHNSEYPLHGFTIRPSFVVNIQHSTSANMSHVTSCDLIDPLSMGHRALHLRWCLSTVLIMCVGTSSSDSSARGGEEEYIRLFIAGSGSEGLPDQYV